MDNGREILSGMYAGWLNCNVGQIYYLTLVCINLARYEKFID